LPWTLDGICSLHITLAPIKWGIFRGAFLSSAKDRGPAAVTE